MKMKKIILIIIFDYSKKKNTYLNNTLNKKDFFPYYLVNIDIN